MFLNCVGVLLLMYVQEILNYLEHILIIWNKILGRETVLGRETILPRETLNILYSAVDALTV